MWKSRQKKLLENPPDMNSSILVVGNKLTFAGKTYHCAIGKNGFSDNKKEGDGCTPLGIFPLRECWYRADKITKPQTNLPIKIITQNDGWCDDVTSPDYNRHILLSLPSSLRAQRSNPEKKDWIATSSTPPRNDNIYNFSHEKLWRDDEVYDLIIPIGYNDLPIIAGKGSAIFIHVARENYEPTEGCVALKLSDLLEIWPFLYNKTGIDIKKDVAWTE